VELTAMTGTTPEPEGLTAVLLQLAGLTQKLADLDHREASATREDRERIASLTRAVADVKAAVTANAEALTALGDPSRRASGPAKGARAEAAGYQPPPASRFWKPDEPALGEAVGKLRGWVEDVYRPGYGHLAASLGDCWDQHPLCLYILDWLSELWSVLYLARARTPATLAGQAEWHTRLLPAAAGQLSRETRGCGHASTRRHPTARPGAQP
jgi:hypothetical protein